MITLALGSLLAVAALLYVLFPLFDANATPVRRGGRGSALADESAIDALREIEFDRATGKLSDEDYSALKTKYTRAALVELRARDVATSQSSTAIAAPRPNDDAAALDAAEAVVLRYRATRRSCPTCGPRPEPDPTFCSSCGGYLRGKCGHCGATVDTPASRFCADCGGSLAA